MLEADQLCVRRGACRVLQGVTTQVAPGEFVAVLGRNGAGKSSLLHALAGTLATQGGAVRLLDRDLSRWRPRDLATRRAVLTQHSSLPFGLQVLDVVLLGRSPHRGRTTGAKDREVAHQALARTETSHLVSRDYLSLSGGERQRVQWARVLAQWT